MATTQTDLALHAAAADLPPVAIDAIQELSGALGDKSPEPQVAVSATDVSSARTSLAGELVRVAEAVGDMARRPCEATLLALSVATLAEAHRLDHELVHAPCRAAHTLAADLLRRHGHQLRRRVRRLLQGVVDGVATEGGRRGFVAEARALLGRARRWRPTCVDVDASMAIRVGGVIAGYRTSRDLPNGDRSLWTVTLSHTSREGRLVLLVADGRPPVSAPPSVVSRVSSALRKATNGVVQMVRDERGLPRCQPPLELTSRARRLAQTVRSLQTRPRVKRKSASKAAGSPQNSA